MPDVMTRADALREYLSGAASAGGAQTNPSASLGNHRSSTEVDCLGISIANAVSGVTVDYASAMNGIGTGTLTATDSTHLTWTPPGGTTGNAVEFSGTESKLLEGASSPGKFLRVTGTTPFSGGPSTITLTDLFNNFFGMDNIAVADATAGITQYRATLVRNVSTVDVTGFKRYIASLGTQRTSDAAWLSGSGSGTITTTGSLADWPDEGWAQVRNSGGTLKEVVYYTSRNGTTLTIPAAGRGLLGTSATAGANTDTITPVPGIALAIDTEGVVAGTEAIQTIASQTTAPASVTWNLGITAGGGLNIGTLTPGQQVGIWIRRHIPAGAIATPKAINRVVNTFTAF